MIFKVFSKFGQSKKNASEKGTSKKDISKKPTSKPSLTCINVIQETHDVKTFQFKSDADTTFDFKPGQFITIEPTINGEKHLRSYTIASSPTNKNAIELTIKLDPLGMVTPWLFKNIVVGATLEYRGPAGLFNCIDIASEKVLLISAGSGITPVMSMARFWCEQDANKDMQFLNWSRTPNDIIFKQEIESLGNQHNNFKPEVICTNVEASQGWAGSLGRIKAADLASKVADLNERVVFCCGPDGFMEQVKSCLQELGFDLKNYHDETFDPGGKKKAKLNGEAQNEDNTPVKKVSKAGASEQSNFQVTLSKSGKTLDIKRDDILLDILEDNNIDVESACRAGSCGACLVKKISGETETEFEDGLDDAEKQQGYILTCTTCVKSDVQLDL